MGPRGLRIDGMLERQKKKGKTRLLSAQSENVPQHGVRFFSGTKRAADSHDRIGKGLVHLVVSVVLLDRRRRLGDCIAESKVSPWQLADENLGLQALATAAAAQ